MRHESPAQKTWFFSHARDFPSPVRGEGIEESEIQEAFEAHEIAGYDGFYR